MTEHYDGIVVGSGVGDGKAHDLDNLYAVRVGEQPLSEQPLSQMS